jgi:mannose-6-phosphate isomerase
MRTVRGVVQHYAWGDADAIPELLGVEPDGRPWAEWWLGTHPGGPATVDDGSPLSTVSGPLPYLTKVLAAAEPLSLQTHPDTATALAGFHREQAAGIAIDDPARIYRDPNAKPEVLCALTPFDALCGFRPVDDTAALLHALGAHDLAQRLQRDGIGAVVSGLYRGTIEAEPLVRACDGHPSPQAELVARLDGMYPGEPSVAVTLFLNRVRLLPGEALYLTPGNLHAYVHGVGVEVMGASDNVVRGGLTPKHVDVEELLRVLQFEPLVDPVVQPVADGAGRWRYPTPGAPFRVTRLDVGTAVAHTARGRELLVCTAGDTGLFGRGEAVFLADGETIGLGGPSTVWVTGEA